jgi:ApbE superfamily uncharacterized protein (UPF0280 family)
VKLLKRKLRSFDIQVQDLTLHIQAGTDLNEESRAAALSFWEQLHAYTIRNPEIRSSKRPIEVPADAPEIVREIIGASRGRVSDRCSRSRERGRPRGRFLPAR